MKKVRKGKYGYIRYEKKKRALFTLGLFALPLTVFFIGLYMTGTRNNILSVLAILGVIPAAKFAVDWIMVMMQKSADPEIVDITEKTAGNLTRAYELVVTAYEGRMPLDAVVVCGNQVVCCSPRGDQKKFAFMEKHMADILKNNGYHSVKVKIFPDLRHYQERIGQLADAPEKYREGIKFTTDEKYPDLSRDELIKHTLLAISI